MDKLRILVTYCAPYDMVSEKTGERVCGCSINYFVAGENNELLQPMMDMSEGAVGFQSAKCSVDLEKRSQFKFVPGFYDASFTMKVNSDRKVVSVLNDVEYVGKVAFTLEHDKAGK